jgi:hypothetical protein
MQPSPTGRFTAVATSVGDSVSLALTDARTGSTWVVHRWAVWHPGDQHDYPRDLLWDPHERGFLYLCDAYHDRGAGYNEHVYAFEVKPSGEARWIGASGADWAGEMSREISIRVADPRIEEQYEAPLR